MSSCMKVAITRRLECSISCADCAIYNRLVRRESLHRVKRRGRVRREGDIKKWLATVIQWHLRSVNRVRLNSQIGALESGIKGRTFCARQISQSESAHKI